MRSIKFRAWDNVADEMFYCGEDVDILFTLGSAGIECTDIRNVSPSGDGVDEMEHLNYMQFTGLTDKYGKEIFEGDVVKRTMNDSHINIFTGKVIFHEGTYFIVRGSDCILLWPSYEGEKNEIIGNIYQHPHLLEESK